VTKALFIMSGIYGHKMGSWNVTGEDGRATSTQDAMLKLYHTPVYTNKFISRIVQLQIHL
jgi:hypothetical protein